MTLRRSVAAIMLAPFLAALTSGCGTIIHGRSQDVLVTSVPSGATAKVGDVQERSDASATMAAVPPTSSATSAGASRLRPDLADLVGVWTGTTRYVDRAIAGPTVGPQPTSIRMYGDGEELRWALTRSSATRPDITASGVVAKSEDKILLRGRYGGTGGRLGGTEVTYTLTRTDVTLSGSGMGADGLLQTISLTKQAP